MKRYSKSAIAFFLVTLITICLFMHFTLLILKYPLVGIEVEKVQGNWIIEKIYDNSWANKNNIETGSIVTLVNGIDPAKYHTVENFKMVEMADSITITGKNSEINTFAISYHDLDFQLIVYFVMPVLFAIFCFFLSLLLYYRKGAESSVQRLILFLLSIGLCYLSASASARADLTGRITTTITFSGSIVLFIHFLKAYFTGLQLEFIKTSSIKLMNLCYFIVISILLSSFFSFKLYVLTKDIELGFVCLLFIFLFMLFARFYYRYKNTDLSSLLKILWVMFFIAFSPFVILYAIPYIFLGKGFLSAEIAAGFLLVIPLAFVYLQLAEKLFDIEFLLGRLRYYSLLAFPFTLVLTIILAWSLKIRLNSGSFYFVLSILFTGSILFLYIKEYTDYKMKHHLFSQKNEFETNLQLYHFFQKAKHSTKVSDFISSLINEIQEVLSVKEVYYVEIQASEDEGIWKVSNNDYSPDLVGEIEKINWKKVKAGSLLEVRNGFCVVVGEDYQRKNIIFCGLKKYKTNLNIHERIWLETLAYFSSILLENFQQIEGLFQKIKNYKEKMLEVKENYPSWLSKLLFALSEKERANLSIDLHDAVLQDQLQLLREIESIYNKVTDPSLKEALSMVNERLLDNIHLIRETCNELRPPFLKESGLIESIQNLIDKIKLRSNFILHTELDHSIQKLDPEYELALYRVIQELLNNAIKHSEATDVSISLMKKKQCLMLSYSDNGIGIHMSKLNDSFKTMGISGIKERITCLGGRIKMESGPNSGFKVFIELGLGGDVSD
ncbi:ATP-binding protein [Caldifermentibacillus hisashii]|uniref:sensor histidine kinase n=1 Tax=Caldifermentibacillus hisashii TaxID=996558 RepID=UPI0031B6D25B